MIRSVWVGLVIISALVHAEEGAPKAAALARLQNPGAAQLIEVPKQLTIDKAEELLIQNNLALIAARYGVDAARAQRIIAAYHPNPSLNIQGTQFDLDFPRRTLVDNSPTASNHTYQLEFDLPIETGGKRGKRIRSAEAQLAAAEAQVLDALRQQLFQMKSAYYSAVLARENAKVAAEVLESVDSTENLIKRQVAGGNIPEAQLITFQANRVQFEQALVSAQLSYEQSIRDLLNFLGATPGDVAGTAAVPDAKPRGLAAIELAGDLTAAPLAPALEELRQKAEARPDVIAAQRNVEMAERNLDVARAGRSPDITVGTQFARVGGDNTGGMTFSVPLPVFNNKEGEIAAANAQIQTARTQLKQIRLQALTDIDKAFRAWQLNQDVMKLYDETALEKARQSLAIAEKAYERGGTSLLEVLDARRTYRQTLVARDQARFNLKLSVLQLELATGSKLAP